ncbi:MAG TPA: DUF58 domain-containing protein [Bacteroidota bacterium]|nr:DUF58 domain-containing protein [Bacteroidota bacterium]
MAREQQSYLRPDVVSRLSSMEMRARLVVEGFITGLHKSPYHGFSVEFAEHRQYMPGDEIRRIDWKVLGRTDRYYIKQFEEETNLKAYLVLDSSRSMAFRGAGPVSKLQYASYLAAAFAYLLMKQQDAVGLLTYDEELRRYLPPHSTKTYLQTILSELEKLEAANATGTGRALNLVAERLQRRGLVMVFSDLFDDPEQVITALKHFRYNQHEVILFHILDPRERDFNFGRDAIFRDMESNEEMMTQPYQIQRAYQEAMRDFIARYKKECREQRIDYVLMDTSMSFDTALYEFLNKRRKIGG